jgi:predicted ATPase
MIKIGITGVHGSGKTTYIKEIIKRSKTSKCVVVKEAARDCRYPLNTLDAQNWIWHEHVSREKQAEETNPDIIICDRTVLDNIVYYKDVLDQSISDIIYKEAVYDELFGKSIRMMESYDFIIRCPLNLSWLLSEDPIREKDIQYALKIDAKMTLLIQPFVTHIRL